VRIVTNAADPDYLLVDYDAEGAELPAAEGTVTSTTVAERVAADAADDVVLLCHGWLDDLADARALYAGWLRAARGVPWPGGRALVVAAHWPSKPFADDAEVARILDPAGYPDGLAHPSAEVLTACRTLIERYASGQARTQSEQTADAPAGGFDPETAFANAAAAQPDSLLDGVREVLLALSFWTMRTRAITLGQATTGLPRLLGRILAARPGVRVHLVGHSMGCLALSGALTSVGAAAGPHAASFLMVQAAVSSWALSSGNPYVSGGTGAYARIIGDGLIDGPLIATTSSHDDALGRYYPLGMELVPQKVFAAGVSRPGRTAAIGAAGLGFDPPVPTAGTLSPLKAEGARAAAPLPGHQYTIDCSAVIRGHNDLDHVELARLCFAGVAAAVGRRVG
jgi:hypothetical protein